MPSMMSKSKTQGTSLLIGSLVWAFAFIATAFLFKGNSAKDWIEAGLFIGALTFLVWKPQRLVCVR
jgi:uncharacterized membrane protein YbhN (UPF0104 family)